ncbi:MAG TPA: peptidyl-prolyl cis-trans isomerase [Deltaproteobacteria bacterium]|nr:peptidyl-prolyl cis-trans isomerase [Deltaproteobacteria bacterium]
MGFANNSFAEAANPRVRIETGKGTIIIELDGQKAPKTVENFLNYARSGFYEGTIFHRVIKGFMIQGGGLTEDMRQKKTNAPVLNEADNGLKNLRGTIAMARTQDPNSATAQFFINTADNAFLDHKGKSLQGWGYCVFGKVVEGLDVVDAIENLQTTSRAGHQDVPVTPVFITDAKVEEPSGEK